VGLHWCCDHGWYSEERRDEYSDDHDGESYRDRSDLCGEWSSALRLCGKHLSISCPLSRVEADVAEPRRRQMSYQARIKVVLVEAMQRAHAPVLRIKMRSTTAYLLYVPAP